MALSIGFCGCVSFGQAGTDGLQEGIVVAGGCGEAEKLYGIFGLVRVQRRDAQLNAMLFVTTEGIFLPEFEPFCNHSEILGRSVRAEFLIGCSSNGGCTFSIFGLPNQVKVMVLLCGNQLCDDIMHKNPFYLQYSGMNRMNPASLYFNKAERIVNAGKKKENVHRTRTK